MKVWFSLVCLVVAAPAVLATDMDAARATAFLKQHCVRCHNASKQEGDVRLDDLSPTAESHSARWVAVRDQLRDGLMPPEKQPRPEAGQTQALIAWASKKSHGVSRLPNQGNLVPHELLFGKEAATDASNGASPARLWRLSPNNYKGFVRDVYRGRQEGLVQPFTLTLERGIKDFAGLYSIDESSTEILLRNAEAIVNRQCDHEIVDGKVRGKNDTIGEFVKLMDPMLKPTREQVEAALRIQFRAAIGRQATEAEIEPYWSLYEKCAADGDRPAALKTVLAAVLLRGDAMYRRELGGKPDSARRMLAPTELARAVSVALCDRREQGIQQAAEKGELTTREQVAAHVKRMLDDPKLEKPAIVRFFREYFEYPRATEIFKDRPETFKHDARLLVEDTDRLVQHILAQDKDVFRQLLTTPVSFVNCGTKQNKQTRMDEIVRAVQPDAPTKHRKFEIHAPEFVYGFDEWPTTQPATMPEGTRIGILMQPSWLVAFSTNFDNDPVRRGRWIR
jgi:hypothetical protein